MDTTTLTAAVKPSTNCPDTEGAVDAVIKSGKGKKVGSCTLIPVRDAARVMGDE